MAKHYDLVGSVHDKYARGNKYKEEEIIKIPGVTFKSLEDIDRFTASFSGFYEFSNSLDDKYQKKTKFSIRITKNNGNVTYRTVIYNNPDLIEIIDSLEENTVQTIRGVRTVKMYLGNNDLFLDAWGDVSNKILKSKVNDADREWLFSVFGEKSSYTILINRYIKGDPFDSETDKILLDLERDFREYEVFRKYLINKDKVNNKSNKTNNELDKENSKSTVSNLNVTTSNIPTGTTISTASNSKSTDIEVYDDKYEPDYINLLTPEEREKAYGEGNEDIEEYRHRRRY